MQALAASCQQLKHFPIPHAEVIPSLSKWIFGSSQIPNEKLQLISPTPVPLRKAIVLENEPPIETVSICVFRNPKENLNQEQKYQLHRLLLPYVVRAFEQNFET